MISLGGRVPMFKLRPYGGFLIAALFVLVVGGLLVAYLFTENIGRYGKRSLAFCSAYYVDRQSITGDCGLLALQLSPSPESSPRVQAGLTDTSEIRSFAF